ncbi:hypothetical protein NP233_g1788 [Leucocoprinus birnbaumii]|uniref:Uncharacterized protein n=1 Tax=Leucocoprinus birnbaumii TaxID=56174 RepID=A0AAD5W0A2_9AGAR|nr:hypothetical protein NP233_g1788 [Leucocoprinus birnbaumii]
MWVFAVPSRATGLESSLSFPPSHSVALILMLTSQSCAFGPLFLVKSPCRVLHVLAPGTTPSHDVAHDISQYPLYYDPIYYPEYHRAVFMSPSSICAWLEDALNFHLRYCPNCLGCILGRDSICPLVTFTLSCGFVVAVSGEQAAWSLAGIASPSFMVCCALKRLLPGPIARRSRLASGAGARLLPEVGHPSSRVYQMILRKMQLHPCTLPGFNFSMPSDIKGKKHADNNNNNNLFGGNDSVPSTPIKKTRHVDKDGDINMAANRGN